MIVEPQALPQRAEVVVIGGGLADLTAAVLLARAGQSVLLLERAAHVGGRAITQQKHGYAFNLGIHAIYRAGAAYRILKGLGIAPRGGTPPTKFCALLDGRMHAFPATASALFSTSLLDLRGKVSLMKFMATLPSLDTGRYDSVSLADWLNEQPSDERLRKTLANVIRLGTYCNEPELLSAGAALAQLQVVLRGNALYVDHGWQSIVDGLQGIARDAGVRIVCQAAVAQIEHDEAVEGVRLVDGRHVKARHVVFAGRPGDLPALLSGSAESIARKWNADLFPAQAACLDVALSRLPNPKAPVAISLDHPYFMSTQSLTAKVAPEGGALICAVKHGRSEGGDAERELEAFLDQAQPGWRKHVVHKRFMPHLTPTNSLPLARLGGTKGRPGPEVPGVEHLYVAGDWVGSDGTLADASLASAESAARLILSAAASPRLVTVA